MSKRFLLSAAVILLAAHGAVWAQSPGDRTDNGAKIVPSHAEPPQGGCVITINGTLGSGSPDWPSTSGTQTGRLNRNGVASTCAVPKTCDIFVTDPGRAYDAYVIPNNSGAPTCASAVLTVIDQQGCNLQPNMYLNTYDPANICEPQSDYLADPGLSSGTPPNPVGPFEGTVPAGDDLIVVVHTTNPGEIGCQYQLVVSDVCVVPVELSHFDVE